jgi:hypothetical protein
VLGLSYREAARALRIREATITTRLFRARNQVAEQLVPEPGPSTPTSRSSTPREFADLPARRQESHLVGGNETPAAGVIPSRGTP